MTSDRAGALLASWSANAGAWTDAVRERRIASRREVTDAAIVEAVLRHRPHRVLDVGCGEGWLCRALAGEVETITGIDGSPELIEHARASGGADFLHIDYARLIATSEAAGSDYDLIVCNFALLDDRVEALLAALARIAAPAGRLIIQTVHPLTVEPPYADGWRTERFAGFGDAPWAEMPWMFRTIGSWVATISTAWRLTAIEEPRAPGSPLPASLLIVAAKP
ncbi:SAM-dependent methyltransferase [Nostoc sp. 3335mG]|nr:SAM-dependent methyltransferase [Nostoc sp. 3335mG]